MTIYGGSSQVPALTKEVKDEDEFMIGSDIKVRRVASEVHTRSMCRVTLLMCCTRCLATPCHTQDSISFFVEDVKTGEKSVFTG